MTAGEAREHSIEDSAPSSNPSTGEIEMATEGRALVNESSGKNINCLDKQVEMRVEQIIESNRQLIKANEQLLKANKELKQANSERKNPEAKSLSIADRDPLTGLPNGAVWNDHLSLEIAHAERSHKCLAVFLLNLDNFEKINDAQGRSVGDQLLTFVAGRIKAQLRRSDTLVRLGGDEFLLLLPQLTRPEDATIVADRIIRDIRKPFVFDDVELTITTSIGMAIYPYDGKYIDPLMANANAAMSCAKKFGRNNYQFFLEQEAQ